MNYKLVIEFIVLALYLVMMLFIGLGFYKKNEDMSDYFLGGRSLNKWVAAMSAQASDMSGWLLMGRARPLCFSGAPRRPCGRPSAC